MSDSLSKRFKHRLTFIVVPFLAQLFFRFIFITSKKVYHFPENKPEGAAIYAFWHGDLLMQNFLIKNLKLKKDIAVIASEHKDGALIARAMNYFGIKTIKGSSSRGAAKALLAAMRYLKEGNNVMITPDGPRGPRHSVANGIISMSQKQQVPIVTHQCIPKAYWRINSWDQFIIAKPFTTLHFYVGEPFYVEGLELNEAKAIVHKRLMSHAF